MTSRLVHLVIIAVSLLLTGLLVPDIDIAWTDAAEGVVVAVLVLALVFGAVNAFIRPIARIASIPLTLLSLGAFSIVVNAGMLLVVAYLVDLVWEPLLVVGGFPPDLSLEAVVTAAVGALIISAVSAALSLLIPET